ncbi:AI-2E family transporter [Candidatus Clostridium radicumherbarum]|uniref:AI-2E family transporter n=1 Tax=Candidatus Clostridium radicumherbarum TaxID=3381662 RepID=A0ABW8TQY0_9CLOT
MKKIFKILLMLIALFLIIYVLFNSDLFKEIVYLLVMSFIAAYSLKPVINLMIEKGINKKLAALSIILLAIVLTIVFIIVIIPSLFKESLNISDTLHKIQSYLEGIYNNLKPLQNNKTMFILFDGINSNINKMLTDMLNNIFKGALNVGENLLTLSVVPIIVYYFLADSEIIFNKILVFFPVKIRAMVKKIIGDIDKILGRYIVSQFVLCIIVGILTFIVLIILHVDYPLLLSVLNAVFNIIPYFGPLLGGIPAVLIAFLGSTKIGIWTFICLNIIQTIEGNIISPKITGDSVSMHPLTVIILLIIGGKVGGFIGMVLAVPIGVVIKIIYEDLNYYLF